MTSNNLLDPVVSAPRILVFLDVDGTIAPLGERPDDYQERSGWGDRITVKAAGMHVSVATELVQALRDVAALPGVEVRWLTDWAEDAHELGVVLGLGPFVLAGGGSGLDGFDYKSAVILHDLKSSGVDRFVWLDDNSPCHSRNLTAEQHRSMAASLTTTERAALYAGRERLIIGPESTIGLTRQDMVDVQAFCRG